jgi:hypothetical protein
MSHMKKRRLTYHKRFSLCRGDHAPFCSVETSFPACLEDEIPLLARGSHLNYMERIQIENLIVLLTKKGGLCYEFQKDLYTNSFKHGRWIY